jgi:hypothetical protein
MTVRRIERQRYDGRAKNKCEERRPMNPLTSKEPNRCPKVA